MFSALALAGAFVLAIFAGLFLGVLAVGHMLKGLRDAHRAGKRPCPLCGTAAAPPAAPPSAPVVPAARIAEVVRRHKAAHGGVLH